MVLKRSVFKIQKQRTKTFKDPSYGYWTIYENVLKLRRFSLKSKMTIFCPKWPIMGLIDIQEIMAIFYFKLALELSKIISSEWQQ